MMKELLADLAAGALLCNCIPHLAAGMRGELFPSPFGRPPGIGTSHPVLNVVWGVANAAGGVALLAYAPVVVGFNFGFAAVVTGAAGGGSLVAQHFHRWRRGRG